MILFIQRILTTTVIKFSNKFFNEISHSILMLIHCVKNEKSELLYQLTLSTFLGNILFLFGNTSWWISKRKKWDPIGKYQANKALWVSYFTWKQITFASGKGWWRRSGERRRIRRQRRLCEMDLPTGSLALGKTSPWQPHSNGNKCHTLCSFSLPSSARVQHWPNPVASQWARELSGICWGV